jgi:glycosyltransferase involved in cell wall biosynthesis
MRIAQLAPTYERVPPATYGGTELVVHLLSEVLVRRGHDVTLFATGDSHTSGRLASVVDRPHRYGGSGSLRHAEYLQLANAQACFRAADAGDFDIVHNHAGIEGLVLAATSRTPVVTTNHLTFEPATGSIWSAYPWFHHGVSAASGATFPERGRLPAVHHGLEIGSYPFSERGDGYLLFLGRLSQLKGPDVAIEVAKRARRRLILAGKVDDADRAFFEASVAPSIDGDRIKFVGEADGDTKRSLLAGADALLFPISWDEPFGLVMVESMATGTPIVAFGRGSVPEIVEHGETGFVVGDADGMAEALRFLPLISRRHCRLEAERRFDVGRMVDDYERLYDHVAAAAPTQGPEPIPVRAGGDGGPASVVDGFGQAGSLSPPRVR